VEQIFTGLKPNASYTLALTRSKSAPYKSDYEINTFSTDAMGKYSGQSTGLIKSVGSTAAGDYADVFLNESKNRQTILVDQGASL